MTSLTRRMFRRAAPSARPHRFQPQVQHLERREVPAAFTPGNLVIYRVGDGVSGLANTGNLVTLDEYTRTGTLVQSIPLPSTGTGPYLVAAGNATSEGFLSLSPDGKLLAVPGYNQSLPNAVNLTTSDAAVVNRSVAVFDSSGVPNFTLLNNFASKGNPRSAVTDGTNLWMTGSNGGVVTAPIGAPAATTVSTTTTNIRQVNIFGGQLYYSTASGAIRIGQVGTGTPTTPGTVSTSPPGLPTSGGGPYGFYFADLNPMIPGVDVLYVANDTSLGIEKFSFDGVQWATNGSISTSSMRGLTGHVAGNCVYLYATNATGSISQLFSLVDMSGHNGALVGSLTTLATAGTLQAFRGVAFTPSATTPTEALNIDTPAMTVSNNATYTVSFNAPITGLTASNFALTTTGDVSGTIGAPMTTDGGLTWTVPVTAIVGDGTLRLDLVNGTGVSPQLFFLPFVCGKTVTVDNAPAVATLSVVGGIATYYGSPGFSNNVTFSYSGGTFFLSDVEPITLGPGTGGFNGGGSSTITAVGVTLQSIRIKLGGGTDTFTLQNLNTPLTVTGGGDLGDTCNFTSPIMVNGLVAATGFDMIQQGPGVVLGATSLDFQGNAIGQFSQPIFSQAQTVQALGGSVFWQEQDGADFTLRATGTGDLNIGNLTGTLRIAGASTFADGPVNLSSGDAVEVNAPLGDGNSLGSITINANTDGNGSEGYSQNAAGRLFSKAIGVAISINVNSITGTGNAVLGVGAATGTNANVTVSTGEGSILWSPELPIPALNASNPNTLGAFSFNFNTSGPTSSVGSLMSPLQLNATQMGNTVANAGTGGVFITDWGTGESNFTAQATGTGDVQIWAGNATNNGIIVISPGITTGTGKISLRADDNLFINGPIGGPGFGGPVFLEGNLDGFNSQSIKMSTPANSITTSNTSNTAVVMNTYSQADTFAGGSVGGIVLSNISVGNGGFVIINAAAMLGNASDANRAGAITALTNTNSIMTGNGTVILTAKNNGIGTDAPGMSMPTTNALRLNITAGTITATANSVASSPAGGNQYDGSIYINATDGASFSATTTSAGIHIGRIELMANGPMRLHGDVSTDDGLISLITPSFIFQDGGTIKTTGTLDLNFGAAARIVSPNNSVGTLLLPPQRNLVVDGVLNNTNPINIVGGTLSGIGKVGAVNIMDDGPSFDGILSPGNSPGIFASGNITWSGGSRFKAELSGPNPGTGYDQLQVTGTVDIGNATLEITDPTLSYSPAPGAKHFLVLNDGIDPVMNTFKLFGEGATVTINSIPYTISYVGNGDGGMVGNDVVLIAPGTPMNPPTVSGSIAINGGSQRSMVQSLVINFSEPVTINPGAFKVEGTALGPIGNVGLMINQVGASVTITFDNTGVPIDPAGSLQDGKYKLTLDASQISGPGGTLDGNGNMISEGSPADNVVFEFHRLFGDGNGDGAVTATDFNDFRLFYGNPSPGLIYDFDGIGGVNAADFNAFRTRYGLSGYLP